MRFVLPGGHRIEGVVKNEAGLPVMNAKVDLTMRVQDSDRDRAEFSVGILETDQNGKWTFDNAPFDLKSTGVRARVSHPDFLSTVSGQSGYSVTDANFEAVMLVGYGVQGTVADSNGDPVSKAIVRLGPVTAQNVRQVETNGAGEFQLANCPRGSNYLIVTAEDHAPALIPVDIKGEVKSVKVNLENGKTLRGKLLGEDGASISDAGVQLQRWRELNPLDLNLRTNEQGEFVWLNAPADEVWLSFQKPGFLGKIGHRLVAGDTFHKLTLFHAPSIKAKIIDDRTGQPIADGYISSGFEDADSSRQITWGNGFSNFKNGSFQHQFRIERDRFALRVGAKGYGSIVRKFERDSGDVEVEFRLKRFETWKDEAWEPIRIAIENGQLGMAENVAVTRLRELGATIEQEQEAWTIRLADQFQILSAVHGIPKLTEEPANKTWLGKQEDFVQLSALQNVKLNLSGFMLDGELLKSLSGIDSIRVLDFDNCPIAVGSDLAEFAKLKSVHEIYLDGKWQGFSRSAVAGLAELPNLHTLVFDGAYHMDAATFAEYLPRMKSLKRLELASSSGFGSSIGMVLSKVNQLEHLGISGSGIDDQFIDQISGLSLSSLDMGRSVISDRGLQKIADSFPDLIKLDLVRTRVTASGIRAVSHRLNHLRTLMLDEMDRKVLVEFQRNHPDCRIVVQAYIRKGVVAAVPFVMTEQERNGR